MVLMFNLNFSIAWLPILAVHLGAMRRWRNAARPHDDSIMQNPWLSFTQKMCERARDATFERKILRWMVQAGDSMDEKAWAERNM